MNALGSNFSFFFVSLNPSNSAVGIVTDRLQCVAKTLWHGKHHLHI